MTRVSKGAVERARKQAEPRDQWDNRLGKMVPGPVPHQFPASVLRSFRRVRYRIKAGRWSGVPK